MQEYEDDFKISDELTYVSLLYQDDDESFYEYLTSFNGRDVFKNLTESDILKIKQLIQNISRMLE